MDFKKGIPLIGTVTSNKCPTCGHHEVGITAKDGTFLPLRPGTLIQVLETRPAEGPESDQPWVTVTKSPQIDEVQSDYVPWVPDPVKGDRPLRLKYGVMVNTDLMNGQMNGDLFQTAYLDKLNHLLENEIHTPLAVVLDRFFAAPHLATGDPKEIALGMWQELEEIRQPVLLVKAWLENPSEEYLLNLIRPKSIDDITCDPYNDSEIKKELEMLSLEDFLGLL